jgi:hypothetical protein
MNCPKCSKEVTRLQSGSLVKLICCGIHATANSAEEAETLFASAHQGRSEVIRAAGTSEGAKKGWETGHKGGIGSENGIVVADVTGGTHAGTSRWSAPMKMKYGKKVESFTSHFHTIHHPEPAKAASEAKKFLESEAAGGATAVGEVNTNGRSHRLRAETDGGDVHHFRFVKPGEKATASEAANFSGEVIHCRSHNGVVLSTDKEWSPGEPVEFMWMPAGVHTICAGFRDGSINLTVECDEHTLASVQASLAAWRSERPKQEPFGCIEHREHEASVRVSASCDFKWNGDGVYLAAEPTTLGAQNVNGKIHRSWSPSFTTDADYSKAIKSGGMLRFPEGVRGSRSNPAQITGVDFCVGTLTNKPAFHAMSPVKGSEGEETVQATWSDAARKAALESRKRHGLEGAKFENSAAFFHKNAEHHEDMVEHHEEEIRMKPTDKREEEGHHEAVEMHTQAARHYRMAAKHKEAGKSAASSHHLNLAERYSIDASEKSGDDSVRAHCHATLLQDVPDATPAEIACYEKCIDEGGSHSDAVTEIRAQRKPEHITQPATPASIAARHQEAMDKANAIAVSQGVCKLTADDVYERCTVTATGTSEGAKKGGRDQKEPSRSF